MKNHNLDKKLVIDREKCIRCGLCERTCWNGALKINRITSETTKELYGHDCKRNF